jgi:hypothetical protein
LEEVIWLERFEEGEGRERLEEVVLDIVCEASDLLGEVPPRQFSLFFICNKNRANLTNSCTQLCNNYIILQ